MVQRLESGRGSCELEGGPGRPVTALTVKTINTGAAMICTDPHLTFLEVAALLSISTGSIHTFLVEHSKTSRLCIRWIL